MALIDCASVFFAITRHYEHNFHLFSEKKALLSFIDHATKFLGPRSVLQAKSFSFVVYVLSHSWDVGPKGSYPGLFPQNYACAYLARLPGCYVFEFL